MKDELTTEERELLDRYRQAARNTARKDKRVNIRISGQD